MASDTKFTFVFEDKGGGGSPAAVPAQSHPATAPSPQPRATPPAAGRAHPRVPAPVSRPPVQGKSRPGVPAPAGKPPIQGKSRPRPSPALKSVPLNPAAIRGATAILGRAAAALGPVGIAAGAVAAGFVAVAAGAKAVNTSMKSLADRIGPVSGHVARALANNQRRRLDQDLELARDFGRQTARNLESQDRLERENEELRTRFWALFEPATTGLNEALAEIIELLNKGLGSDDDNAQAQEDIFKLFDPGPLPRVDVPGGVIDPNGGGLRPVAGNPVIANQPQELMN